MVSRRRSGHDPEPPTLRVVPVALAFPFDSVFGRAAAFPRAAFLAASSLSFGGLAFLSALAFGSPFPAPFSPAPLSAGGGPA